MNNQIIIAAIVIILLIVIYVWKSSNENFSASDLTKMLTHEQQKCNDLMAKKQQEMQKCVQMTKDLQNTLNTQMVADQAKISGLTSDLDKQTQTNQAKIADLNSQLAASSDQVKSLNDQITASQTNIANLNTYITQLKKYKIMKPVGNPSWGRGIQFECNNTPDDYINGVELVSDDNGVYGIGFKCASGIDTGVSQYRPKDASGNMLPNPKVVDCSAGVGMIGIGGNTEVNQMYVGCLNPDGSTPKYDATNSQVFGSTSRQTYTNFAGGNGQKLRGVSWIDINNPTKYLRQLGAYFA